MTQTQTDKFAAALNAKHEELARDLARRDGIAIERTADALDEVRLAAERELSTRSLERGSALMRHVRAALGRIEDGSYGTCQHCEEEISPKRLTAMPWAKLCIGCQEESDRRDSSRFGSKQQILTDAA